jgi:hypothetical protein
MPSTEFGKRFNEISPNRLGGTLLSEADTQPPILTFADVGRLRLRPGCIQLGSLRIFIVFQKLFRHFGAFWRLRSLRNFSLSEMATPEGDAQNAAPRHPARIRRHWLLPSVAEKVRPSTSVSCIYLAPAIVPEAGTGNVTVAAAPILARIPKGPGSNLL